MRCDHELKLHDKNCFVTLTYNKENLPPSGVLKGDFQRFMKRLRYKNNGERFKFFACGEYGEGFGRPHYHALLFGFDFSDKVHWAMRNGRPSWRSDQLEELWTFGNSEIGEACFESAAYVARYLTKYYDKGIKEWREQVGFNAEFLQMSRGGKNGRGLGYGFYERYPEELLRFDSVVVRGHECKPPRYYDKLLEEDYPDVAKTIKALRRNNGREKRSRELDSERKILEAKIGLKKGGAL
jgi:hypothetical protein